MHTNSFGDVAPSLKIVFDKGGPAVSARGEWTAPAIGDVEKILRAELERAQGRAIRSLNVEGVSKLDATGALLLRQVLGERNKDAVVIADDPRHRDLLELAAKSAGTQAAVSRPPSMGVRFLANIGKTIVEESRLALQMASFLGEYLVVSFSVLRKPKTLPVTSLVYHMEQVGVAAVPIVALLSFLIGLVIAYMGAQQLARFGAEIFVINLVEITTLRELGVLLTSIVIAGRSGSSFTAQIGAMKANEEVDAMRTMGLSPMLRLAFPRITALALMLPALVFLADVMGILGGGVAVWSIMGMTPGAYAARMQDVAQLSNFFVGMVKAPFFAVVIGVVGCFQGFQVTGSAESVGRLTTHSVVQAIFMVIVLDAAFALFFTGIGV